MRKFRLFLNKIFSVIDNISFLRNPLLRGIFRVVVSAIIMAGLTALVYYSSIPNPNMILITGLVVCSAVFSIQGAIVAFLDMVIYSMFFFSKNHSFFEYTEINLNKLIVIVIGAFICALIVVLYRRTNKTEKEVLLENNRKLSNIVYLDALTAVKNRYAFRNDIKQYQNKRIIIMILDIDNFKEINDTLGHQNGDLTLSHFANELAAMFSHEHTYRYGGDEFLVLSELSVDDFMERLEDFKQLLGSDKDNLVRFSAGFVDGTINENHDYTKLIKIADKNLYDAKQNGKDCYKGSSI